MPIKIIVRLSENEETQSEHTFDKPEVLIGRNLSNDVVLPDMQKKVSGKHAQLELKAGRYWVTDLGSTNGTFLNQRRITANTPVQLSNKETLGIGNFQLLFSSTLEIQGATELHVDPSIVADSLEEKLNSAYAQHREESPDVRKATLAALLRERLESTNKDESRAVLALLRSRFGSSASGGEAGDESEITKQEELYRAGFTWIQGISRQFLNDDTFDSAAQVERFAKQIMQTLESTLTWVSRNLKSRRAFEDEFSADLTMVFSKEGNPLKSAADPAELGRNLLDWRSSRDLESSRDLLENAYKDLTMHQLGLVAGVQDCLKALLQQLDPKVLQSSVVKENSGALKNLLLSFSLSKKSWNKYTGRHQELLENNSKLFNELIYPELRKGYLGHHGSEETPAATKKESSATEKPAAPKNASPATEKPAAPKNASPATTPTPPQNREGSIPSEPEKSTLKSTPSSEGEKP